MSTKFLFTTCSPPSFNKMFYAKFPLTQNFTTPRLILVNKHDQSYGLSVVFDMGHELGQAKLDFGADSNGLVQQFFGSCGFRIKVMI